jgi:hypothetical protein
MTAVKKNQVFMIGDNNGGREWHLFGISPLANRYGVNEIVKAFESSKKNETVSNIIFSIKSILYNEATQRNTVWLHYIAYLFSQTKLIAPR